MNFVKLGVLILAVSVAVSFAVNGHTVCSAAVDSVAGGFQSEDGSFSGPLTTMIWFAKAIAYAVLLMFVSVAAIAVFGALGIGTWIVQRLAVGIQWLVERVKQIWAPDVKPDVVVGSSGGVKVTLRTVLADHESRLEFALSRLTELEYRTSGVTPPPPPKTPDQVIAELQAKLAAAEAAAKPKAAAVAVPAVPRGEVVS